MERTSSGSVESLLLGPDDVPPVEVYNPTGRAHLVIVSDHASRRVPATLGNMGLEPPVFDKHIAYDIGADRLTRRLADRLDAPAVIAAYSRLVVDLNRPPGHPDFIPGVSDGISIPANQGLTAAQERQRIEEIFNPYHQAVDSQVSALWHRDQQPPAVFSVHTFTPSLSGKDRIWDIGVLWNLDPRMAEPLLAHLREWEGLHVGANEPYSGRDLAYTIDRHGTAGGIACCAVEVRQDHCATPEEASHWADILAEAIRHIFSQDDLHAVRHF